MSDDDSKPEGFYRFLTLGVFLLALIGGYTVVGWIAGAVQ